MPIQTLATLRRARARADRHRNGAAQVLTRMQRGAALHQHFTKTRPIWSLSDGTAVAPDVAKIIITDINVVGVGDGLFGRELSQTFRYVEA